MMDAVQLSESQKKNLEEFRTAVKDCMLPHQDEKVLLPWLRARGFDVTKAEKMLRDSLEWRQQWDVDHIVDDWQPPEVLKKYYPLGFIGYSKEGCPVWLLPYGQCDIRGILHSVTMADYMKYTVQMLECSCRYMQEQTIKLGHPITEHYVIFDLENFSIRHIIWKPALESILQLVQMYEANYPEVLRKAYVINAPKIFTLVYSVVKPFLHQATLQKMIIFGQRPRQWKTELLKDIDPEFLPVHWGGSRQDPDGNPKCPSLICPGGVVPTSYYMKTQGKCKVQNGEDLTATTVKKGKSLNLEYEVQTPGSVLRWEFHTDSHDIGFAVFQKTDLGMKEVVGNQRVNSHLMLKETEVICQEAGTYVVQFDNSFSWMRSKMILYSVYVVPSVSDDCNEQSSETTPVTENS